MENKESIVQNQKGNRKSIGFPFLRKIRLRHWAFLLVVVVGLALTTTVIIILWRISTPGIVGYSGVEYVGIIGVLIGLVAAFMGILATIMFGNAVYTTFISQRAIEKLNRHDKNIPDLYVISLKTEANECEREGNILRAIDRRIGVINHVIRTSYSSNSNAVAYYIQALKKSIEHLTFGNISKYYREIGYSTAKTIEALEYFKLEFNMMINKVLRSENGLLIEDIFMRIKDDIDDRLETIISQLKSETM